jgi:hypothetical protein
VVARRELRVDGVERVHQGGRHVVRPGREVADGGGEVALAEAGDLAGGAGKGKRSIKKKMRGLIILSFFPPPSLSLFLSPFSLSSPSAVPVKHAEHALRLGGVDVGQVGVLVGAAPALGGEGGEGCREGRVRV